MKSNPKGIRVLIAGSFLQLFLGIVYVWSVFVQPVHEWFGWPEGDVKLTSSFMLSFFVLGILAGGKLLVKIGAQKVVLVGGLMLALGMLGTSFVPEGYAWLIYVTYGIVGGFGVGMGYNAIVSCGQKWFPDKRGVATGVSVCAFGFSTVVFAPLIETLIRAFGLLPTFRILAAAFFLVVLSLFHFIVLPENQKAPGAAGAALPQKRQFTTMEMLKTKQFYFITMSMMLGTAAFFILNPSFKSLATDRGLTAAAGTALVMVTGVANALGRLVMPALSDRIGRENTTLIFLGVTAVGAASLCVVQGYAFMAVVALIAFCYGSSSGLYPLLTADHFGLANVGSNYGAVMVGFALSALFFPMLLGPISNVTVKFLVLAGLATVGAMFMVLLGALRTRRKER